MALRTTKRMFEFASSWAHLEIVGSSYRTRGCGAALAKRALIARKRLQIGSSAAAGDHGADGLLELVQAVELGVRRADLIHADEMGVGVGLGVGGGGGVALEHA